MSWFPKRVIARERQRVGLSHAPDLARSWPQVEGPVFRLPPPFCGTRLISAPRARYRHIRNGNHSALCAIGTIHLAHLGQNDDRFAG